MAGASTYDGIRTSAANAIASFLARSPNHQVGICSYIGWGGRNSGQKRRELEAAVTYLNRQLQNRGIPLNQLCHLFITSDQNKHPVNSDSCHLRCDDQVECHPSGAGTWGGRSSLPSPGTVSGHRSGVEARVFSVGATCVHCWVLGRIPPHHSYD